MQPHTISHPKAIVTKSIGMLDTREQLSLPVYSQFIARRFLRLMPALWGSVILAVVLNHSVMGHGPRALFNYFTLRDISFDGVAWTLVLEIGMCLIYPFMAFAAARFDMITQLICLVAVIWLFGWTPPILHYGQVIGGLPILAFYLGLLVPTVGRELIRLLPTSGTLFVPLALLLYMAPEIFMSPMTSRWFSEPGTTLGHLLIALQLSCFYLISWLIYSEHTVISNFLRLRAPMAMGRWS
jgi:peptidoglycan/LPS O-acetylase OafA/YrhL